MSSSLSKFKSPLLLGLILIFSLVFGSYLSPEIKAFFYAVSLTLKELLIFGLPLFIFAFVLNTVIRLQNRALQFALLLVPSVILSNFLSTWTAYVTGSRLLQFSDNAFVLPEQDNGLLALWSFALPRLISNDVALLSGFLIGIFFLLKFQAFGSRFSEKLVKLTYMALDRFFIPCMPVFILGFTLKLQHDEVLVELARNYLYVFLVIVSLSFCYITMAYFASFRFSLKRASAALENMLPALITGLSTMSSAASMPFTILGTQKNTHKPELAQSIIPATVNIHLVGDCFAIPILAMAVMHSFGFATPSLETYLIFSVYFVLAKFAVAAVPGGGILVMLPILEQHLQFSAPMLSWITTLYIMFDPVITAANVLGNGAFAIVFSKVFTFFSNKNTGDYSSSSMR